MRGRVFRGTHESMAALQPFVMPEMLQNDGVIFGILSNGCDFFYLNPFTLPGSSTGISISGVKGSGKSTWGKSCSLRLPWLQVYDVLGNEESWRTRIMTRKSEEGVAEWLRVIEYVEGAKYYALGHGQRINLIGLLKRLTDLINFTINIVQEIGKRYDDPKVSRAISIAVTDLYETNPNAVGEELLRHRLRQLTLEDFQRSYLKDRERTQVMFAAEFKEDPVLVTQLGFDDPTIHHVDGSFIEAAHHAADCLDNLVGEAYGSVFGGSNTMYEMLIQRYVLVDTEDVPENAVEMIEAALMKAEASAIRFSKDDIGTDRDMTKIVPHLAIHDEEGSEASTKQRGLMHLRYATNKQNKSRAYATCDMYLNQYEYQTSQAGAVGSEMRNLSRQFMHGFERHIFFKQSSDVEVLNEISQRTGMSDEVISWLPGLDQGEFVLYVRDQPAVRAKHLLLPSEVPLIDTESARRRGSSAIPVWEQDGVLSELIQMLSTPSRSA